MAQSKKIYDPIKSVTPINQKSTQPDWLSSMCITMEQKGMDKTLYGIQNYIRITLTDSHHTQASASDQDLWWSIDSSNYCFKMK